MIGSITWAASLGIIDVKTTVIALASFISDPTQGHRDRCKRVVSHLAKFKWVSIRIRTEEPDLSSIQTAPCDCGESIYVQVKELIPDD